MTKKLYSHLPPSGIQCPYCQNKANNTSDIWREDGFEKDSMSGNMDYRGGWFIYTEE